MSIEKVKAGGVFTVSCYDKDGNLKWEEKTPNLVVNEGLDYMNTQFFTGSSYTAAWYLGLYGAASSNNPAAGARTPTRPRSRSRSSRCSASR